MRKLTQHKGTFHSTTNMQSQVSITSSQFSKDGSHFAVGDTFGRIVVFTNEDEGEMEYACEVNTKVSQVKAYNEGHDWKDKTDIQPSVKHLQWMENLGTRKGLVSAGNRDIKLWKMHESANRQISRSSCFIPIVEQIDSVRTQLTVTKSLPSLHTSSIKGLSLSSNEQYLLSFDPNRILKWNLQISNQPHIIFSGSDRDNLQVRQPMTLTDKDNSMRDEATEEQIFEFQEYEWSNIDLITCAKLHDGYDNKLAYSNKNGKISYLDMRVTNQTKPSIVMACPRPDNFLKRYISNISGFCFVDDYTIVARNYLYVKVWDLRNSVVPKARYSVNPSVNDKICDLYENGRLSDQFSINIDHSKSKVVTSHYDCSFHEIDLATDQNLRYRVNSSTSSTCETVAGMQQLSRFDGDSRVNSVCYNPFTDEVCATIQNSLFVFNEQNSMC